MYYVFHSIWHFTNDDRYDYTIYNVIMSKKHEMKYCPFCGGTNIYMKQETLTRPSLVSKNIVKEIFKIWHCRTVGCKMSKDGYFTTRTSKA